MDCARGHLMPRMKPWKRRDQFLSLQRLLHGQRPSCMFRNGRSESSPCSKGERLRWTARTPLTFPVRLRPLNNSCASFSALFGTNSSHPRQSSHHHPDRPLSQQDVPSLSQTISRSHGYLVFLMTPIRMNIVPETDSASRF